MGHCWKVLLLTVVVAGMGVTANGQGRGRHSPRRGGGDPADRTARQMERAEGLIRFFDANQDGVIEPNEVHGQRRYVYERLAKQAGLDPTHSVSVGEFRAALGRYFKKAVEGGSKSPASKKPASGAASGRGSSKEGKPASGGESAPKVPGFGVQGEAPKVSGFGPASGGSTATPSSPSRNGSSKRSSSPGSSSSKPAEKKELDSRIRKYAESLLRRYDANKNGVLEKDEWSKMRNNPEKADRNRDKVVTGEELTTWLSAYSQKSSPPPSTSSPPTASASLSRSTSSRHSHSSRSEERKSYRFLTPTERLPKGLPDWFARKDANGDGQVSMAEYHSGDWDEAKAAEFAGYDLNNDGMITPAECLEAAKTG